MLATSSADTWDWMKESFLCVTSREGRGMGQMHTHCRIEGGLTGGTAVSNLAAWVP